MPSNSPMTDYSKAAAGQNSALRAMRGMTSEDRIRQAKMALEASQPPRLDVAPMIDGVMDEAPGYQVPMSEFSPQDMMRYLGPPPEVVDPNGMMGNQNMDPRLASSQDLRDYHAGTYQPAPFEEPGRIWNPIAWPNGRPTIE